MDIIDKLFYYFKNNIDTKYKHQHELAKYDSIIYINKSSLHYKNYESQQVKIKKLFSGKGTTFKFRNRIRYNSSYLINNIAEKRKNRSLAKLKRKAKNKKITHVPLKLGPHKYYIIFRHSDYIDGGIFNTSYHMDTIFTISEKTIKITSNSNIIYEGPYLEDDEIFNYSLNDQIKNIEILYSKNLNRYKEFLKGRRPAIYNIDLNLYK